eukprot:920289-Rhodomonas_salina.1
MPSSELAYDATRYGALRSRAVCSTSIEINAQLTQASATKTKARSPTSLRGCYAMSGTDLAHHATGLQHYPPTRCPVHWPSVCCHVMPGTDLAYAGVSAYALPMRCPVLT